VRHTALLLLLVVAAGCSGGDDEPRRAMLEIHIVDEGQRRSEVVEIRNGQLGRRIEAASDPAVFSRAGTGDRQSIAWEEIYLREPGGSVRRLTNDRNPDLAPQLLGDGRVAFVSCPLGDEERPPDCRLDAIDPSDGARETLLDDLGVVFGGRLSPDERRFLFTRLDEESGAPAGLFVREFDGGDERRLVDGYGGAWSPDGRKIAFVSDRDENGRCLFHDCTGFAGEIYLANDDGGDERRLTDNPQTDSAPAWSGDGEWIVFARIPDEEDDWDLHAVRADGECERQLTDTQRWEVAAVWRGGGDGGLSC
jgi:Tol biopolymer transport system component